MAGRSWLLPLGLASAVGLPYLSSSSGVRSWVNDARAPVAAHAEAAAAADPRPHEQHLVDPREALLLHPEGPPARSLDEVIRFDMSPADVLARWPRVSTRLAKLDLQGYRVPLVTGTADKDLAGALTYYFSTDHRVARVTFHGVTGDPRPLVELVTSRYGLRPNSAAGPGTYLYQMQTGKMITSELRVRPAGTVSAGMPNARFEVSMFLERPTNTK